MPSKNSGKQSKMARRRRLIAQLYHRGYHRLYEIMEQLELQHDIKISIATVSTDMKYLREKWEKDAVDELATAQGEILDSLNEVMLEAYRGWLRSIEDAETIRTEEEEGHGEDGSWSKNKTVVTRSGQSGDAQFLKVIESCIRQKCKILGAEAARMHEVGPNLKTLLEGLPAGFREAVKENLSDMIQSQTQE